MVVRQPSFGPDGQEHGQHGHQDGPRYGQGQHKCIIVNMYKIMRSLNNGLNNYSFIYNYLTAPGQNMITRISTVPLFKVILLTRSIS